MILHFVQITRLVMMNQHFVQIHHSLGLDGRCINSKQNLLESGFLLDDNILYISLSKKLNSNNFCLRKEYMGVVR